MSSFKERRQRPRVTVREPLAGRAGATMDVRVLDLGLGGVRLQHEGHLRPGAPCILELPPAVCPLPLLGLIVRSAVVRIDRTVKGEQDLCYESAIAFDALHPDQEAALTRALERLSTPDGVKGELRIG